MSAPVQIDKSALKTKAEMSFNKKAKRLVHSLCECWPYMIDTYLMNLNKTIEAGRTMGVTSATAFSNKEIGQIASELSPLAELEMHEEMRAILIPIMRDKGFGDEVLDFIEVESQHEED